MSNVKKSNTMTFQSGVIHTGMSEESVSLRSKVEGATYWEGMKWLTPSPDCGVELTDGSMTSHHRLLHMADPAIDCDQLPGIQT